MIKSILDIWSVDGRHIECMLVDDVDSIYNISLITSVIIDDYIIGLLWYMVEYVYYLQYDYMDSIVN